MADETTDPRAGDHARHPDPARLRLHPRRRPVHVPPRPRARRVPSASGAGTCGKVYVPSRGTCPTDGVATTEDVMLGNSGTVTTYCVVNVPFAGQSIEIPYICAQILLDGANLSFMGLIQEIPTDQIRMGMRVEAVWVDESDLIPSLASVQYFRPNGEPDADYDTYKEYL